MGKQESAHIVEWYDKLSSRYSELYGEEQALKIQRALELIVDHGLDLGVDVACGTGRLLGKLSSRCRHVVGLDLSRRMLELAKGLSVENSDLIRADCSAIPLRGQITDCSFAISLIEANRVGRKQVSELARITKPKSSLVVTVFHPDNQTEEVGKMGLERVKFRADLSPRESLFLAEKPVV